MEIKEIKACFIVFSAVMLVLLSTTPVAMAIPGQLGLNAISGIYAGNPGDTWFCESYVSTATSFEAWVTETEPDYEYLGRGLYNMGNTHFGVVESAIRGDNDDDDDNDDILEFTTIAIPGGIVLGLFYVYRKKRESRGE